MQILRALLVTTCIAVASPASPTLERTVVDVLRKYTPPLQRKHGSLLIENRARNVQAYRSQEDLINGVLGQLEGEVSVQFDVKDVLAQNNLIFVDGDGSFQTFIRGWNRVRYSLDGYYWIVVCQKYIGTKKFALAQRMLHDLWELKIVYGFVSIADVQGEEDVEIFTSWPYSETHCGAVRAITVNWRDENLLNDRLKDFYGCPLRVGAFDNQPFVQLDWDRLGRIHLLGFEGLLVNAIAEKLNFSVEVVTPPNNDQWGYAKRDGNSTGLIKLIVDETVHFGICSFGFTEDRDAVMAPGVQHYNSYVVFGVPSGRPYTAFEKLFLPFGWDTWYAVFGTMALTIGIVLIINTRSTSVKEFIYGRDVCSPITNLINILLGGPLDKSPKRTFARTLVMLWMIFALVIRTAYQGSLYKYLQVPKNFSAPLTMNAIYESGLYYYMIDLGAEFFTEYPQILARTRFVSHEQPLLESFIQLGRGELYGVVLGLVDHIAYHNKFYPKDEYVQAAREAIVLLPMTIYYPKRTFLRHTIDREVQLIDSSGLMQYWANQYADYDFSHERTAPAAARALSVDNLVGAIEIWVVLLVGASLMFLVELATKWGGRVRRLVDWMEED